MTSLGDVLAYGMRFEMMSYSVYDMASARRAGRLWMRLARLVHYVGGVVSQFHTGKLASRVITEKRFTTGTSSGRHSSLDSNGALVGLMSRRCMCVMMQALPGEVRRRRCPCRVVLEAVMAATLVDDDRRLNS
jgi:hypothetical protein